MDNSVDGKARSLDQTTICNNENRNDNMMKKSNNNNIDDHQNQEEKNDNNRNENNNNNNNKAKTINGHKNISEESNLFVEYKEAIDCIAIITADESSSSCVEKNTALARLRIIYDKYLQCPTLLDKHIGFMMDSLTKCARFCMQHDRFNEDNSSKQNSSSSSCCSRLPHILSAIYALSKVRGRKSIQKLFPHNVEDVKPVFETLNSLAKNDKEEKQNASSEGGGPQQWESIYVLWIWMGKLSLVPFNCTVIAGSFLFDSLIQLSKEHLYHTGPTREVSAYCLASWLSRPDFERNNELSNFVRWSHDSILQPTKLNNSNNKNHNNIFVLLGTLRTLVTILKMSTICRQKLLIIFSSLWETLIQITQSDVCNTNLLLRKLMMKWWSRMGCTYLPPKLASWRYQRGSRMLHQFRQHEPEKKEGERDVNKGSQSSSSITNGNSNNSHDKKNDDDSDSSSLLQDSIPDHVEDAMGFIIEGCNDPSTVVRWSAAKGIGRLTQRLPSICADDVLDAILELFNDPEKDQSWHGACLALAELARRGLLLPYRLCEIIPFVVRAIQYDKRRGHSSIGAHVRDAACYTYWAFARAYAPSVLKPFMSELSESIVVASLFDREVNCRRAASAAFQEFVGRFGSDNFKHGISILTLADYFSLGNRKDAYTTIAFRIAGFNEYCKPIIREVYKNKLFHWDHNIRILASKSLYGLSSFDTRSMSKTVLPQLLGHCLDEKNLFIRHGSILGSAEIILALGNVYEDNHCDDNDSTYKSQQQRQQEKLNQILGPETIASINGVVPILEKKRLYRGRGGEMIRLAVCRLICCISMVHIPSTVPQQVRLLDSIDACIPHPNKDIQKNSCVALHELMRSYFPVGPNGPSQRLQKRVVDKYIVIINKSDNPAATRGFALALGHLPAKLLAPSLNVIDSVLRCLCRISRHDSKVGNEHDAETRCNALTALKMICQTVGAGNSPGLNRVVKNIPLSTDSNNSRNNSHDSSNCDFKTVRMNQQQVATVFDAFFLALEDYNIDRRGDVGSWSRIAAMEGITILCFIAIKGFTISGADNNNCNNNDGLTSPCFNERICIQMIGSILKQFAEKLDSVREHAGKCLEKILTHKYPVVPYIPQRALLVELLGLGHHQQQQHQQALNNISNAANKIVMSDWSDTSRTFHILMDMAFIDEFFFYIISGIIISVGGLTESVAENAKIAFLRWIKNAEGSRKIDNLANGILKLFDKHSQKSRVINPLLKSIDMLFVHQSFNGIITSSVCSSSSFPSSLILRLQGEEKRCSDIHRLLSIVDVSLGLLGALSHLLPACDQSNQQSTKDDTIHFVCSLLCHCFPRIRRYIAENLYVVLLDHPELLVEGTANSDEPKALELLLNFQWDSDQINQFEIFIMAKQVASDLGVILEDIASTAKSTKPNSSTIKKKVNEFESYAALLENTDR